MAGDYTRMTFEPRKDHAGVLMQQGRVTLDSDWNAFVRMLDRRLRAETIDIIGRCVVPKETPDGFRIEVAGGALTIGAGRAYVHGLLAENHGADPVEFDPVLEGQRGTQPVAYEDQPYFPNAKTAAPLPSSGTHIAYLDVWQREVTHVEDPELVEKAIDIDTATRLQTAWQVRLLRARAGTTCDSRLQAWDDLTAPPAGRLSTAAVGVPAPTDPCTIPPSGGYRGTENRLYRIEIHDAGPLGTATFKWSRDNASVASRVTDVDAARKELTLVRLGRDTVQRIDIGDWVEVTDDWREFEGVHGELFKVVDADDVDRTITLDAALPASFDPTDPSRNTRVRRWDQSGATVDAAGGVVAVPAAAGTPIVLEHGVEIRFDTDPGGGSFRVGDYWVCAARTADASVEILVDEPPRGVHHHFCRLAVVTFPSSETDCRTLWPPDSGDGDHGCDCTVCVTPESHANGDLTIQQAVDMVRAVGGKVCLQAGFYRLDRAVRIVGAQSIELCGKGWRTILLSTGREPAILVERSLGVAIRDLTVVTTTLARKGAIPRGIAIALRATIGTLVERCVCVQLGTIRSPRRVERARRADDDVALKDLARAFAEAGPRGAGAPVIALDGLVLETRLRDNVLVGTTGIGPIWADLSSPRVVRREMDPGLDEALRTTSAEAVARGSGYLLTFDLAIEDNLFLCWLTGVALEGFCLHLGELRVSGNSFLGCRRAGIVSTGYSGGGRIDVLRNLLRVYGYGIAVGVDDARVADNDVGPFGLFGFSGAGLENAVTVGASAASRGSGILLAPSLGPRGVDRCLVSRNRVVAVGGAGIEIVTQIRSALISGNVIQRTAGSGIEMSERASADTLTVSDNQLLDVAVREGGRGEVLAGVLLLRTLNAAVVGNTIARVGTNGALALARAGIAAGWCAHVRLTDNEVVGVGPVDEFVGLSAGLVVEGFLSADVIDNVSRRSDEVPRDPGRSAWFGILVGSPEARRDVQSAEGPNEILLTAAETAPAATSAAAASSPGAFGRVIGGAREAVLDDARVWVSADARFVRASSRGRDTLAVRGNLVEAYGGASAVLLTTNGSCLFNDNRSFLSTRRKSRDQPPVADLTAAALVVGDNFLEGLARFPALVLDAGRYTVLGNITSGPIRVDGGIQALPSPWKELNV